MKRITAEEFPKKIKTKNFILTRSDPEDQALLDALYSSNKFKPRTKASPTGQDSARIRIERRLLDEVDTSDKQVVYYVIPKGADQAVCGWVDLSLDERPSQLHWNSFGDDKENTQIEIESAKAVIETAHNLGINNYFVYTDGPYNKKGINPCEETAKKLGFTKDPKNSEGLQRYYNLIRKAKKKINTPTSEINH